MARKQKIPPQKKSKYRLRNWKEYNRSLVNRGSITVWFDEKAIQKWYSTERSHQPGHPDTYSDDAIRCGVGSKSCVSHYPEVPARISRIDHSASGS